MLSNYKFPYGSKVYHTPNPNSDTDWVYITQDKFDGDNVYTHEEFQERLNKHDIMALECYFLKMFPKQEFKLDIVLANLRRSISGTSSNSFVKAKKKINQGDYYLGYKSLFHSLRILDFGYQIATTGNIYNYQSSSHHFWTIYNSNETSWDYFKPIYQPIYNSLATSFKKVAPL